MKRSILLTLATAVAPLVLLAQSGNLRGIYARVSQARLPVSPGAGAARSLLESGNDKIDPALRLLVTQSQGRGPGGIEQTARGLDVPMSGGQVEISVIAEDGVDPDALRARIEDAGGKVAGIVDNTVLARVPISAISGIGSARNIYYVARQEIAYADFQRVSKGEVAAGVQMVKANKLHERGIRGKGVKVGILDFGFGGYHTLETQGIVPQPKAAVAVGNSKDWAVGTVHGAACAEIIHSMAPEADIYLAMIGDGSGSAPGEDIVKAARWLAEQKVDIISYSGGSHGGPQNGQDILDKLVEEITGKGILWVNSAGNEGDSHWGGPARDANHDTWVDIGPKGEPGLALKASDCGKPQCPVTALVVWNDWGPNPSTPAATQDLDAFLFAVKSDGSVEQVAQSVDPQQGRGRPVEFVGVSGPPGQIYLLALRTTHITEPVRIHVFTRGVADMYPAVKEGSISIPATSKAALAVAAIDVTNGKTEDFSSRGPTDDDRMKPDVAGPDNDLSTAYKAEGHDRFPGTSAACPHVSGMAALLRQINPRADVPTMQKLVMRATRKVGATAPNNDTGYGIIDGDAAASGETDGGGGGTTPAADPGQKLSIPATLGGSITVRALERMRAAAGEDSSIQPKVVVGRPEYHPGDGLKIGFKVEEDCFYLLVHRDSQGHYTVLAPTRNGDTRLRAGERYAEPAGENRTIRITPPAGVERVLLICATDEADLESWRPGSKGVAVAEAHYEVQEN